MKVGHSRRFRAGQSRKVAQRKFKVESLEDRSLLAGDVLVTIVQGDIQVTGDGDDNDIVITADPAIPGRFSIDTGADPTDINGGPGPVVVQGAGLRISMGGGNDTVTIEGDGGAGSVLPLNLTADLGNGDNIFSFSPTGGYTVIGGFRVKAGAGEDTITIADITARDMYFLTGDGGETIDITNSQTTSGGIAVSTGAQGGGVPHTVTMDNVDVAKHVDIILGAGDSVVALNDMNIVGNLNIRTGAGLDDIDIGTSSAVQTGGDIYVSTGNGDATIDLLEGTAKLVTIKTGVGEATMSIVTYDITKSLLITNGRGNDVIDIDNVSIGKDISIVNDSGDHDISVGSGTVSGFIAVQTRGGIQNFDLGSTGALDVTGSITMRNGVTGEVTFNGSNFTTGIQFSLITGRGTHTINVGQDGPVSAERGFAIRSDGGAVVTMDDTFVGLDLSVTLGNTLGLSEMFIGTNLPLTVLRNASFRTGIGDTNITIGAIDIGGNLVVQSRSGADVWAIGGISGVGDLLVGGQTIISSGLGDDIVDIGIDSGAISDFTGKFNCNLGPGDDSVTVGEGTTGFAFSGPPYLFVFDGSFGDNSITVVNGTAFDPFDPVIRKQLRNFGTNIFI